MSHEQDANIYRMILQSYQSPNLYPKNHLIFKEASLRLNHEDQYYLLIQNRFTLEHRKYHFSFCFFKVSYTLGYSVHYRHNDI